MFRIVLICKGVPAHVGAIGARDIAEEFTHRPWHQNVSCVWDGSQLILQADNDFDENGLALLDEFSDSISACVSEHFDADIEVRSINKLS
jgi:hypothetical protein